MNQISFQGDARDIVVQLVEKELLLVVERVKCLAQQPLHNIITILSLFKYEQDVTD